MFCVAIYLARKQDAKSVRRNDGEGKRQLRCSRAFLQTIAARFISFSSGGERKSEREKAMFFIRGIFYLSEKESGERVTRLKCKS